MASAQPAEPRSILRSSSMTDMAWCSNTSDDGAMSTEGDEVRREAFVSFACWWTPGSPASHGARAGPHGPKRAPRDAQGWFMRLHRARRDRCGACAAALAPSLSVHEFR
jgi:hypothetical protein